MSNVPNRESLLHKGLARLGSFVRKHIWLLVAGWLFWTVVFVAVFGWKGLWITGIPAGGMGSTLLLYAVVRGTVKLVQRIDRWRSRRILNRHPGQRRLG